MQGIIVMRSFVARTMRCKDSLTTASHRERLESQSWKCTLILVTRYFGGTLLGTGGLIRAYGQAALEGLKDAKIEEVFEGVAFELSVDYESIGKIKYNMVQFGVGDAEEEYGEEVTLKIQMKKADFEKFKTSVIDATSGKAELSDVKECEYREKAELDG